MDLGEGAAKPKREILPVVELMLAKILAIVLSSVTNRVGVFVLENFWSVAVLLDGLSLAMAVIEFSEYFWVSAANWQNGLLPLNHEFICAAGREE